MSGCVQSCWQNIPGKQEVSHSLEHLVCYLHSSQCEMRQRHMHTKNVCMHKTMLHANKQGHNGLLWMKVWKICTQIYIKKHVLKLLSINQNNQPTELNRLQALHISSVYSYKTSMIGVTFFNMVSEIQTLQNVRVTMFVTYPYKAANYWWKYTNFDIYHRNVCLCVFY